MQHAGTTLARLVAGRCVEHTEEWLEAFPGWADMLAGWQGKAAVAGALHDVQRIASFQQLVLSVQRDASKWCSGTGGLPPLLTGSGQLA